MKSDKSRKRFVFLCVAPATILFFIFMILPTLNVFRMSLYERGAYSPNETFVGLKNFQHLLKDTQFIRSMQNMILLVVVVTIITFAFALVFAAVLTREKIKGQNFFRIIFYIPNILSVVVISGIFSAIYKPENGMLNSIIGLFRDMTDPLLWKGEKLVIPSIIIAMVWQAVGYYMVMQTVPFYWNPETPKKAEAVKTASAGQGLGSCFRMQLRFYSMMLARIWSLADLMPSIHCCSVVLPETRELTGSKNTVRTSTPGIAVKEAKLPLAAFAPLS